jgi:hypothetical protein
MTISFASPAIRTEFVFAGENGQAGKATNVPMHRTHSREQPNR